jgi:hypothetical protein
MKIFKKKIDFDITVGSFVFSPIENIGVVSVYDNKIVILNDVLNSQSKTVIPLGIDETVDYTPRALAVTSSEIFLGYNINGKGTISIFDIRGHQKRDAIISSPFKITEEKASVGITALICLGERYIAAGAENGYVAVIFFIFFFFFLLIFLIHSFGILEIVKNPSLFTKILMKILFLHFHLIKTKNY